MSTPPPADLVSTAPGPAAPAETAAAPKTPQFNIYMVMLGLALLFICLACLFLFFELQDYELKLKP